MLSSVLHSFVHHCSLFLAYRHLCSSYPLPVFSLICLVCKPYLPYTSLPLPFLLHCYMPDTPYPLFRNPNVCTHTINTQILSRSHSLCCLPFMYLAALHTYIPGTPYSLFRNPNICSHTIITQILSHSPAALTSISLLPIPPTLAAGPQIAGNYNSRFAEAIGMVLFLGGG